MSYNPPVGKIDFFLHRQEPSIEFPFFNLSKDDCILSSDNWPLLVPYLRNIKLKIGEYDSFPAIGYVINSNGVTIKFNKSLSYVKQMFKALKDDHDYVGTYINLLTITLSEKYGHIEAGTYNIIAINEDDCELAFNFSHENISENLTANLEFYPFRISGSETTARHRQILSSAIMSNDYDGCFISGLRKPSKIHSHRHDITLGTTLWGRARGVKSGNDFIVLAPGGDDSASRAIKSDGANGIPVPSDRSIPRCLIGVMYIYGGTYNE